MPEYLTTCIGVNRVEVLLNRLFVFIFGFEKYSPQIGPSNAVGHLVSRPEGCVVCFKQAKIKWKNLPSLEGTLGQTLHYSLQL